MQLLSPHRSLANTFTFCNVSVDQRIVYQTITSTIPHINAVHFQDSPSHDGSGSDDDDSLPDLLSYEGTIIGGATVQYGMHEDHSAVTTERRTVMTGRLLSAPLGAGNHQNGRSEMRVRTIVNNNVD